MTFKIFQIFLPPATALGWMFGSPLGNFTGMTTRLDGSEIEKGPKLQK